MREKSMQIFIMIKCQKKIPIVFVCQWFKIGRHYYQAFFEARKCNVKENELDIFLNLG